MGGYLTGGGHSPLSHIYGLGAEQVYEVEMVTPTGEIVIANECQNSDLFWAVRGVSKPFPWTFRYNSNVSGRRSHFRILTKVTVRTIPSPPVAVYDFSLQAEPNSTVYWEIVAYLVSQYPTLSAANISSFTYLYPSITPEDLDHPVAVFEAVFAMPDPTSASALEDICTPLWAHVNETYPNQTKSQVTSTLFPDLYSLYLKYADASTAGVDKVVASWLLPSETMTDDALLPALVDFAGESGAKLYMVSGRGVWDTEPSGGSDAVNPAWRKALIHADRPSSLT